TFPGLTQLLPSPDRFGEVNLYKLPMWPPEDELRPRQELLERVREVQKALAPADERFFLIAGVNQKTVTGLVRRPDGGFSYEFSPDGDGVVPVDLALLPGARTWYVEDSHGTLPTNPRVAHAIAEILGLGTTNALPGSPPIVVQSEPPQLCLEEDLRKNPYRSQRDGALSQRELRHLLDEVVAPQPRESGLAQTPSQAADGLPLEPSQFPGNRIVINQTRQHRLDLRLALGSITEADTRAIALGIFRDVAPSGPARALDERLGGTITELFRRRMFSGEVGEIFLMPTGKHPLAADHIAFVGLGSFDRFNEEVLQTAAENVIRTFINTRVEEFSTVLFGVGSGERASSVLHSLLTGFLRGLLDADRNHFFHRVVICEKDRERYAAARQEFLRLSTSGLCQGVQISMDEVELPSPPLPPVSRSGPERKDPVYLIVRREGERDPRDGGPGFEVRSALLTAGSQAMVVSGTRPVSEVEIQACVERLKAKEMKMDLTEPGTELADLILAEDVRTVLLRHRDRHLVVVHDAFLSRMPWEILALHADRQSSPGQITFPGGPDIWFPAAEEGMSRRYAADNLSVAKWLEQRIHDGILNILLVLNPTEDLEGAEAEGAALQRLLGRLKGLQMDIIRGSEATRPALLKAFSSGKYDVIHYAGHAEFDPASPEHSGLLCHNEARLTGADLVGVGNLPTLVFFNACESARVRRGSRNTAPPRARGLRPRDLRVRITEAVSFAEAFLRGGIANFIGTYWPVGDREAEIFSLAFYEQILRGRPLGQALQVGREAIRKAQGTKDWANYILYGNPDFVLKEGGTQGM
ncbi:MAG TPA: CHAT domain-containing protein, partial [Thermoanaerobaculia bacterium]|nr:CHAT domain-containing protein [Thermoanaerobaculia bacterium]